jgi:pyruvate dehydrogenase E2 component (dihydrolipoyllysine-residue acetyltransferase)
VRVPVEMPKFGPDSVEGRIASWLKRVGDPVVRGEPIAEIETDKVTLEMEALQSGVLVEIVQAEGSDVLVGELIAYLEVDG